MARDFLGARPQGRMISSMVSIFRLTISCGVLASLKRVGVMVLTRASVHCADRRTAMRRVYGS